MSDAAFGGGGGKAALEAVLGERVGRVGCLGALAVKRGEAVMGARGVGGLGLEGKIELRSRAFGMIDAAIVGHGGPESQSGTP